MTSADRLAASAKQWLHGALDLGDGEAPFPWQQELLARFASGVVDRSLDIPTGLGKTAVMAIWLVARALGAPLPRRLVYVVDRRAVVDQATDFATKLRLYVDARPDLSQALGLDGRSLPISTLRGQHVDNKDWLEDPSVPAIIVGTVDMIGSRILFEGYATSRKMRPYHAGLLGTDCLVALDEAHLVPPFEKLLEGIAEGAALYGPRAEADRQLIPSFRLLSLSATGRTVGGSSFGLQDADLVHPVVRRRLDARKRLAALAPEDASIRLKDLLAAQAWKLSDGGSRPVRCIVFCNKREDAAEAQKAVALLAAGDKKSGVPGVEVDTELFVGGRRVFEREGAAGRLKELGFIAGTKVERTRPSFVFATSAGEVGVDLDADHMVSDLVAWERMVQRLGRVNRRGDGAADVIVVLEPDPTPSKAVQGALAKARADRNEKEARAVAVYESAVVRSRALARLIERLPRADGTVDASPGALLQLRESAAADPDLGALLVAATTPMPLRPALTRALLDAWAMTSLKEHTGRPEIDPWLRGWIDEDPPQTSVVWRSHLPLRGGESPRKRDVEEFFEAAPAHASEMLSTETYRVTAWLIARAETLLKAADPLGDDRDALAVRPRTVVAIALTSSGDFDRAWSLEELTLSDTDTKANAKKKEALEFKLRAATLVVDSRLCGLTLGLLDEDAAAPVRAADDGEVWLSEPRPVVGFRVRVVDRAEPFIPDPSWRERHRFVTERSEEGDATRWLVVEKWRHDAATEEDRSGGRPQLLSEHQAWTEERARRLAQRLGLPVAHADMLALAARLHDEGKRAKRWQRAFNAAADGEYAKTRGPLNVALLDGYRHEFGSLPIAAKNAALADLPADLRDLALHLVASHHGFARPLIGTKGCEDLPPSALEELACEVARRFARLQKQWGPWGLAWWESLLRASDQQASRDNDARDAPVEKEKS